jgi:hypothetical protein
LKLFDFFLSKVGVFVVFLGITTFSELEFKLLASLPLLIAGNLGDFDIGDKGGEALLVLLEKVGGGGGGGGGDFGAVFFRELRLSSVETKLHVG